jgi:hypothetical protein
MEPTSIPSFRFLEDCKARDLIRIDLGGRTEWALVRTKNEWIVLVCVVTEQGAPYLFDAAAGHMGTVKQEYDNPVLWYGQDYSLRPDHAGPCDVNAGPLFGLQGTMLQSDVNTTSTLFLCCAFPERGTKMAYYNIGNGTFSAEPGGSRASYGGWSLCLDKAITATKEPVAVTQFLASAPTAAASDHEPM